MAMRCLCILTDGASWTFGTTCNRGTSQITSNSAVASMANKLSLLKNLKLPFENSEENTD